MFASRRREEGAIAVTTAIILTVLIGFAALVIDLGLVRADVRSSQSAADAAVTAAGLELDPRDSGSYQSACVAAWQYFLSNIGDDPSRPTPCAPFANLVQPGISCESRAAAGGSTSDPNVDRPLFVEAEHGDYVFYIQMPVPDSDPLMTSQPANEAFDGDDPCERIGLTIRRDRENLLGGLIGFSNSSSAVDAVSRRVRGGEIKEFATLIILEPEKCLAIRSQAGTGVVVFNLEDPARTPPETPGVVTSDSSGAECSGVIYETGGNGYICAGVWPEPRTRPYREAALEVDDGAMGKGVCDNSKTEIMEETLRSSDPVPGEWGSDPEGLAPDVVQAPQRVTRQPIDHTFNCQSTYGTFSSTTPQYYVQDDGDEPPIPGCVERQIIDGVDVGGIDMLVDAFVDAPVVHRDAVGDEANGFVVADCSSGTVSAARVIVDCKKSGTTPLTLEITNAEHVVIEQFAPGSDSGVSIGNGEYLRISAPATDPPVDAVVVLPEGGISLTGSAELRLTRAMAYLHQHDGPGLNSSSSGLFSWTAPEGPGWIEADDGSFTRTANCTAEDVDGHYVPAGACFEDLSLWSNSGLNPQKLAGQSNIVAEGIFFLPNAGRTAVNGSFALNGGGSGLDLSNAQFFVWRLSLEGQAPVIMRPNPDRFVGTPAFGVGLIR